MPRVTGVQQRRPYSGSSKGSSNYDYAVDSDSFMVDISDESVAIYFPRTASLAEGVGLVLPIHAAQAVAHMLLAVTNQEMKGGIGRF